MDATTIIIILILLALSGGALVWLELHSRAQKPKAIEPETAGQTDDISDRGTAESAKKSV